jgi:hypothetical protein
MKTTHDNSCSLPTNPLACNLPSLGSSLCMVGLQPGALTQHNLDSPHLATSWQRLIFAAHPLPGMALSQWHCHSGTAAGMRMLCAAPSPSHDKLLIKLLSPTWMHTQPLGLLRFQEPLHTSVAVLLCELNCAHRG